MDNNAFSQIKVCVRAALTEDIGTGDVTSDAILAADLVYNGRFVAKAAGIIAGLEVTAITFSLLDQRVQFIPQVADGKPVEAGQVVATIGGPGRALLGGERVALNFLQRMSGIATTTRRFVAAVVGTSAVILDTRKTVPGLRLLDKWAVRLGGGQNHRFGLYDMALIKDNHIMAAGSITEAVARVRTADEGQRPIEVEVKTLDELREALALEVDRIMLDNMSLLQMREAVELADGRVPLEASGNVTLDNVAAIAATGADHLDVVILSHPECSPEVVAASDFLGSTAAMIQHVEETEAPQYLLLTECAMGDNIAAANPDKEMLRPCSVRCPHTNQIRLEDTRDALKYNQYVINVPEAIRVRALRSVERMLAIR